MRYSIRRTIYPLAAPLLFAACTQDEMPGDGNILPEGKYPLEIASVTMDVQGSQQPWSADAPQTRVSENPDRNSSKWNDGDKIKVQIVNGTPGTYTYQGGNLTVAEGDVPAYWANKNENQAIRAWYTSSGSETVELDNQTRELAYVLTAQATANFNTQVSLAFGHALAKVRVVLQGFDKDKIEDVKIKTYTSCTLNADGTLTAEGDPDFISMGPVVSEGSDDIAYWEANVVPTEAVTDGYKISGFKVKIKDSDTYLSGTLKDGGIAPAKAKVNTITLTVGEKIPSPDELPTEINGDGEYTISGTGTKGITITGGSPTITFKKVNIKAPTAINITGGKPKLIFEGTTSLESTGNGMGAISLSGSASVEISGDGTLNLKANTADPVGTWFEGAIIGSAGGETCGDISISGITLYIKANAYNAAIGSGERNSKCGNIAITDATVHITECAGGAGIGTSLADAGSSSCGDIRIENSDIEITYGNYYAWQGAAIGCAAGGEAGFPVPYPNTVSGIYITLKSGQSQTDFLGKLTTTTATGSDKVGQGYNSRDGKKYGTITNSVHWYNADGDQIE